MRLGYTMINRCNTYAQSCKWCSRSGGVLSSGHGDGKAFGVRGVACDGSDCGEACGAGDDDKYGASAVGAGNSSLAEFDEGSVGSDDTVS